MECKFSDGAHKAEVKVKIDMQVILKRDSFNTLGLLFKATRRLTRMLLTVLERGG